MGKSKLKGLAQQIAELEGPKPQGMSEGILPLEGSSLIWDRFRSRGRCSRTAQ